MKERKKYYRRPSQYIPKKYNPLHLAYMAGIIDGEGCFFIGKANTNRSGKITRHHRCCLKIDSTDEVLITWIMNTFSGVNSARMRWTPTKKYERNIHTWVATGDRLTDLCEQILPYLVIKTRHCENIIKFRKTFSGKIGCNKKPSPESIETRESCLKVSRKLNSRWHLHPLKN